MKIAVPKQTQEKETRVALVPASVKKLVELGVTVLVESGAGAGSHHSDDAFHQAGATILTGDGSAWAQGDVVVTIHSPNVQQAKQMQYGAVLVGMVAPSHHIKPLKALAQSGVTVFSLEWMPRISRAQPMDVLSSQGNVSGYMAVVLGAMKCPKMFPMMITAAGTLAPAKVFVIGAGVAGLQAIATAKRLGAVVEAYDVRPSVKEQIQSVGGRFVELPTSDSQGQTADGYAKGQTDQQRQQQIELMSQHVIGADVVITTAAVFGKDPPLLIPQSVVDQMRSGSVIVDLAADVGAGRGNCEATMPGTCHTTKNGVTIEGTRNLPTLAPSHSSQLYANNMVAFLREILPGEGRLELNLADEIQKAVLVTHQGQIVHSAVLQVHKAALAAGEVP